MQNRDGGGGGGLSRLFVQNFWSHSTENFVGEHFGVSENFGYRKILCIREGGIMFSVKNFLSHSTEKFRWGTLRCLRKFRVSQNFMHKKRISLNSVENFLSHSAEKFRKGILLFLRKFLVSKNFMHSRGYHVFPSKIFGPTVPKNFEGTPSMFQKIWGIEKFYA